MLCLYLGALLAVAGGIHSTPVSRNFSFEITSKLQVIVVRFGGDAVVNCKTNDPSANVTLQMAHPKPSINVPVEEGKISRNGSVFTIHNIIVHDGGKYHCVAEKSGQVIRREILLTIDTRDPDIAIIPFVSRKVLTGSNVFYTCEATMGNIEWYKVDGLSPLLLPAASLVGVSVKSSVDQNGIVRKDLVFKKVENSHAGTYKCRLTHEGSTLEKSVRLAVSGPRAAKIIKSTPHDVWATDSQEEDLICVATGFPEPKITWTKDGKVIENCHQHEECAQSKRYLMWHKGLSIVQPRYPDDDGVFSCEARNIFGSDSRQIVVIVPALPKLYRPVNQMIPWTSVPFKAFEIPCVVSEGSPDPTFSWSYLVCFWGKCPKAGGKWEDVNRRKDVFQVVDGNSRSTLKVISSRLPQRLKLRCKAKNVKGEDQIEFYLSERSRY